MIETITLVDAVDNGLEQLRKGRALKYPVVRQSKWNEPYSQIQELMADVRFLRDWNKSGLGGDPNKVEYYQEAYDYLQQLIQN